MLKRKTFVYGVILIILDILAVVLADLTSIQIRTNEIIYKKPYFAETMVNYTKLILLCIPIFIIIYYLFKLYRGKLDIGIVDEIGRIVIANIVTGMVLMSIAFLAKISTDFSRGIVVLLIIINIGYTIILRMIIKVLLHKIHCKEKYNQRIAIIGTGDLAKEYIVSMKKYSIWGYNIIGLIKVNENKKQKGMDTYPIIGSIQEFVKLKEQSKFDEVVIALNLDEMINLKNILELCDLEGIRIKMIPPYYEFAKVSTNMEEIDGIPVLSFREVPLDFTLNKIIKRIFDIIFSSIILILISPIMIFVSIGVKISSPGPIFFKQERIGRSNKSFNMLKFRSMRIQAANEEKVAWTTANDPRKTKFGDFIRKTSLDELPQFINVLLGNMSVVGPRPERPYWVNEFKNQVPDYMLRHYVKAGITGWAQVNGLRGDTSIPERIKYDNYYIQNWTLWMDIKIVFLTVFKGFINKNAY